MAYLALNLTTEPNGTAYDAAHPTRSTELYANALHNLLKDMDDEGFYIQDMRAVTSNMNDWRDVCHSMVEKVFDYAALAIATHRAGSPPALSEPSKDDIGNWTSWANLELQQRALDLWIECHKMMYKIYYMWMTEDDPLLIKEKLQELLIAWPLTDTEIILNEEGGQSFRVIPAWKNVDI